MPCCMSIHRNNQSNNVLIMFILTFLTGAIYVDDGDSLTMRGNTELTGNSALSGFGGAVYVARCPYTMFDNVKFTSNLASWGGAVASFSSGTQIKPLAYTGCTMKNNSAVEDGGGIYSVACYDDIQVSSFSDNFAGTVLYSSGREYRHVFSVAVVRIFTLALPRRGWR